MSHRGAVIFERYDHGARADRPANVKSASKSIVTALVGIAIDCGVVKVPPSVSPPLFRS